jgi:predicted extracellular nuclease
MYYGWCSSPRSGTVSPFVRQTVTGVMGIVTAVGSTTFFIQDVTGDDDDTTSDALVVFTGGSTPSVSVGDLVSVSGTVAEFTPGGNSTRNLSTTQIGNNPTVTVMSSKNALPDPIFIGGGSAGRIPPTKSMADAVTFFAALESMRVTLVAPVAIAGTNKHDEIFALVDNGTGATGRSTRGTLNIAPDNFNPERVQIDTDSTISSGISTPDVNTGAVLTDVTGVLGYVRNFMD